MGISEIICWFMDFPSMKSMTVLAEDVRPAFGECMRENSASVVTGAASGVGYAVASSLIATGRTVIGVDRAWDGAEIDGLIQVAGSVGDRSTWDAVLEVAETNGVVVDQLVINAAQLRVGGVLDISDEDFASTMNVNVTGAFLALRACLPGMLERFRGQRCRRGQRGRPLRRTGPCCVLHVQGCPAPIDSLRRGRLRRATVSGRTRFVRAPSTRPSSVNT